MSWDQDSPGIAYSLAYTLKLETMGKDQGGVEGLIIAFWAVQWNKLIELYIESYLSL